MHKTEKKSLFYFGSVFYSFILVVVLYLVSVFIFLKGLWKPFFLVLILAKLQATKPCYVMLLPQVNPEPNTSQLAAPEPQPRHSGTGGPILNTHAHHDRTQTRSPVNFREGRRASDGLVAQGIIAFKQKLKESMRAQGMLELRQEHQYLQVGGGYVCLFSQLLGFYALRSFA